MRLTRSDLVNTDLVGGVLSVMGVGGDSEPRGAGLADFTLQVGQLDVERFLYVNGATEIIMYGRVADVRMGMDSPIDGRAIGSLRWFRDSETEALNDLGRILRAFQAGATTVNIDGTLDEPIVRQGTIANVNRRLKKLLGSE